MRYAIVVLMLEFDLKLKNGREVHFLGVGNPKQTTDVVGYAERSRDSGGWISIGVAKQLVSRAISRYSKTNPRDFHMKAPKHKSVDVVSRPHAITRMVAGSNV